MYNKKEIINSIGKLISDLKHKLTIEEIESLENIKGQLSKSKREMDILKWSVEILKVFEILKDIF